MGFQTLQSIIKIPTILNIPPEAMRLYWGSETSLFIHFEFPKLSNNLIKYLNDRHWFFDSDQEENKWLKYVAIDKPRMNELISIYNKLKHLESNSNISFDDKFLEFNWSRHHNMYILIDWTLADSSKVTLKAIQKLQKETNFDLQKHPRITYSISLDPTGIEWFLVAEF